MSSTSLSLPRVSSNKHLELQRAEEVEVEAEVFLGDESCNSLPDLQIVEPGDEQQQQQQQQCREVQNEERKQQQPSAMKSKGEGDKNGVKGAAKKKSQLFQDSLQDRSKTLRLKSQKATERIKQRSQSASRALVTKSRSFISKRGGGGSRTSSPPPHRASSALYIDEENLNQDNRGRSKIRGRILLVCAVLTNSR